MKRTVWLIGLVACGAGAPTQSPAPEPVPAESHTAPPAESGPAPSSASDAPPRSSPEVAPPGEHVVDSPPLVETLAAGDPVPARLRQLSMRRNRITDVDRWLAGNELALPATPPAPAPARVVHTPDYDVHLPEPEAAQVLVVERRDGSKTGRRFDVSAFALVDVDPDHSMAQLARETGLARLVPTWAWVSDGLLYVSHQHRTYAALTLGRNAYITAIALDDGHIVWRSRPLVSNAASFVVVGDHIVAGYGFTSEDDALYLLDRRTGAVVHQVTMASGPELIIEKAGKLYVRAYNRDYVFEVTAP